MQFSALAVLALASTPFALSLGADKCWADLTACEQENGENASACKTRDFVFAQCANFKVKCANGNCCDKKTGKAVACA